MEVGGDWNRRREGPRKKRMDRITKIENEKKHIEANGNTG